MFRHALPSVVVATALMSAHVVLAKETPLAGLASQIHAATGVPDCSDPRWRSADVTEALKPVVARAEAAAAQPVPPWDDNAYRDFSRTGNREAGQAMLFRRQQPLPSLVLAECHEHRGRFLPAIDRLLKELATQPSWTLPAHDLALANLRGEYSVDLNASELGHDVGWALHLLGEALPASTRDLVMKELDARIFTPVLQSLARRETDGSRGLGAQWWLEAKSNWNAVCLSGVVGAALAVGRPDAQRWIDIAQKAIPNYLAGFDRDGYADEGPLYWNYGFGQFLRLRESLYAATAGRVDIANLQTVAAIAAYPSRIEMAPGVVALFGDAPSNTRIAPVTRAHAELLFGQGDLAKWRQLARDSSLIDARLNDAVWRLWGEPRASSNLQRLTQSTACSLFEDSGVVTFRPQPGLTSRLAMTVRLGGSKTHSHDDAGSYAIALGNVQIAGDVGAPTYTRDTFGPKRRSNRLINSWGHPVPVVDEHLQLDATKVAAKWREAPCANGERKDHVQRAEIDLKPVYDAPQLGTLRRSVLFGAGSFVELDDTFEGTIPISFETALVTHGTVAVKGERILVSEGNEELAVEISASRAYEIAAENVTDDPLNRFTRVAIRLRDRGQRGCISLLLQDSRAPAKALPKRTACEPVDTSSAQR